jgi:membrane fusion protein (multidrug efflux system)
VVPQEQYDQYTSIALVEAAKVDSSREAAASARKVIAARQAEADAAKAALDQALLNLSYTRIYAPANGIVGKGAVQLGSRIQPGQTLMFVTETDKIWVTGNFKETQLARMHDEPVTIHVDTFGRDYRGYVEHMPGASGDLFSLLPPENSTGNYVKVVQQGCRSESCSNPDKIHIIFCIPECQWSRRYGCNSCTASDRQG